MKYNPLTPGQVFNRLTIISLHHKSLCVNKKNKRRRYKEFYLCKCACGNYVIAYKDNIKRGHTKSCGCLKIEKTIESHKKHGQEGTRLYRIWQGIKKRCFCKTWWAYKHYGGRGITVCDEWKNDFVPFYDWSLANGYNEKLTIDRIDVNGNYEPANCRWATMKEQANNRRKKRIEDLENV